MAKMDDRPDKDLLQMIDDCRIEEKSWEANTPKINKDLLMQKLCSYIVRRDSKVWNHAYKLGQQKAVDKVK